MAGYELRAMSVGEILDGGITIYRRNFGLLITIAVVCVGAPALMNVYVSLAGGPERHPVLSLLALVLASLGGFISAGATVSAISEVYLGHDPTVGESLERAFGRFGKLMVSAIAKYLVIFLGTMLLIVPGIIAACGYAVVAQVIMLENPDKATDGLTRSWGLTRGFKGKAFSLGLAVFLLVYIPFIAMGVVAGMVGEDAVWADAAAQILSFVIYPLIASVFTLFYYDLRVRQEAFDLEILSHTMERAIPA